MIVIEFPEVNRVIAKDQPQYLPMPTHLAPDGTVTCCWRLTWRERLKVLINGTVWQQVLTYRLPLQPQLLSAEKPELVPEAPLARRPGSGVAA